MKKIFIISCLILGLFGLWQIKPNVFAEQSGSSPESGATSRIKEIYTLLATTYGQGSDASGSWGDWGAYWNRIRSVLQDFSQQSLVEYVDCEPGDSKAEESTWTNPATNVWQDSRTGLYWSNNLGEYSNIFPDQDHSTCDFFDTVKNPTRGHYFTTPDTEDADCGNAINACGNLSLEIGNGGDAETDWYLPSQKEIQQAYIDGMYNADVAFATNRNFWSSTEDAGNPANAWYVRLSDGYTRGASAKIIAIYVRCVRRD